MTNRDPFPLQIGERNRSINKNLPVPEKHREVSHINIQLKTQQKYRKFSSKLYNPIMKIFKNKAGLILAEALVAIGMMATGSIILGSIVTTAASTSLLSRDYLIVQNLTVEGAEAVKIIRDTNWLKEPNDKTCWLRMDPSQDCSVKVTAGSSYIVTKNTNNQWMLEGPMKRELNLETGGMDEYRLYMGDLPYTSDPTGEPSPYYRSVKFLEVSDDSATFEVTLQWKEGAKVHTFSKRGGVFNYL